MSYQVIARKWRPQNFEELIGQNHVSRTLFNALRSDRLPHALLFTGPRGVGKTSSARILAKSLKCPNAQDFAPCNECSVCQEIAAGSSLDVIEIDGASHNGVEAIRELRETVGYMPSSGKYKVYIIDEVHMLSTSAFNALLKTLEEPPAHVIFIFATTEVQKIPMTILSRCQRFDFRRIPTRMITERLQEICDKEGVSADQEALWLIARQADGAMRDSQSLLDQIITFCDGKISLEKTIEVLGLTDRGLLVETLKSLVNRSSQEALSVVEKLYLTGADPKVFVQELIEEIRHLLLVKMSPEPRPSVVDLPDSEIETLRELAQTLSEEDIHLLFDMALKGGQDFSRAQDPRLVLEMLLLRMSNAPRVENLLQWRTGTPTALSPAEAPTTTIQGSTKPATRAASTSAPARPNDPPLSLRNLVTQGASATTSIPSQTSPGRSAQTVSSSLPLTERWAQTVTLIQQRAPSLGAKLEHVAPLEVQDSTLILGVDKEKKFLCDQLSEAKTLKEIEDHVKAFWGTSLSIRCQAVDGANTSPAAIQQKKAQEQQSTVQKEVESHPFIQKTQKTFKARIKSIRPESDSKPHPKGE